MLWLKIQISIIFTLARNTRDRNYWINSEYSNKYWENNNNKVFWEMSLIHVILMSLIHVILISSGTVDTWSICNNIKTIFKTNEKQINFTGSLPQRNRIHCFCQIHNFPIPLHFDNQYINLDFVHISVQILPHINLDFVLKGC